MDKDQVHGTMNKFIVLHMNRTISLTFGLAIITTLVASAYVGWQINNLTFALAESGDAIYQKTQDINDKTHSFNNTTAVNEGNITIKKGQEFTLHLESNPTTGYEWTPVFNVSIIILTSHSFKPSSMLIGAAGMDNFIFKGISHGTTSLEMQYKRSWEKDFVKEKVYLINVI